MNNDLIEKELKKVEKADLTHFDSKTNTYTIPKLKEIKLEEDKCYLIHIKPTLYRNEVLKNNWNNGKLPNYSYLKVDIVKIMSKMIKVVAVGYDYENKKDLSYFWNGWLSTDEIEILQKI